MMLLSTPFIYLFTVVPRLIYKALGTSSDGWQTTFTEGELRMMIDLSSQQGAVNPTKPSACTGCSTSATAGSAKS